MAQGNNYGQSSNGVADESPNMLVYRKMEDVIARMQDEKNGIPIRTVKSFLSKIPSVFSGSDIVQWLTKNLSIEDPVEALHLGTLMAAHGYFFPISDHVLTLKDDGTFYRFQTPYFWPSNCWEPENTDYGQCGSLFSFSLESYIVWMKIHLNHLSPTSLPKPPLALISEPWARTANAELKIGFGLQSLLRQRLNLLVSWEYKNSTLFAKYFENALTKKIIQR